ncbi:D-alanyl-D-alanine carboxypeptidase family protein [Desulfofundulus thermocisternus]|uniref:D-alanyl-D-alanine carboxypeptidase family protein n=1 Tax=Desulfofundulus thermocisternus TaxID=42471 RepID=UPI001A0981C3|nr:D-alanyl-D-alanine carboxypeptidase family protein [Desulfofundulus thermocisternus]MBE3585632.1 D-alanyl-D-alanine carboxypeptidase [Thermoanaerobacter sp.]
MLSRLFFSLFLGYMVLGAGLPPALAAWASGPCMQPALPVFLNLGELPVSSFGGQEPRITAEAAVLMEASTGQVLFAKNAHQARPPASTTKILTALLAIEGGRLNEVVTVSSRAAAVGESSMHLFPGQRLTLKQLLYGALLRSGNDACVAIAEHIAGSERNFVFLMNQKARELGACQSHFCNPHGLPAQGHVSSAYDLALLARYALRNPTFRALVSTRYYGFVNPPWGEYHLHNTNRLLWSYQGADGVKTGTTSEAGMCLVASASRGGRQLISVVLHSDDRYGDTMALLDYGFSCFKTLVVTKRGEPCYKLPVNEGTVLTVPLVSDRTLAVAVPVHRLPDVKKQFHVPSAVNAPVFKNWPAGTVDVWVEGQPVARARLLTGSSVHRLPACRLWWKRISDRFRPV